MAIDEHFNIAKLKDLSSPYFFIDEYERNVDGYEYQDVGLVSFPYKSRVYKVVVKNSGDLYTTKKVFDKTYEADVRYLLRLFIDGVLEIADYRDDIIVFYDIETTREGKIISIYAERKDGVGKFFYGDEKDIVCGFMNWLVENNGIFLLAWNGFKFDFPITGEKVYHYCSNKMKMFWDLIEKLDYMLIYKKYVGSERLALDYVAKMNGIEGKVEHEEDIWEMSVDKLEEYNTWDVKIMLELERKYGLMNLVWEIAKMINIPVSEVVDREYNGKIVGSAKTIIDVSILRRARELGYVLPTANYDNEGEYEGAFVYAKKGVYDWVMFLDFASLYPSIMLNEGYGNEITLSLLKEWYDNRFKYKREWKNSGDIKLYYKQYALKILVNSSYGVYGYKGFRLYNRDIASKITGKGRELILSVKHYVESVLGYDVVLIDTDSNAVHVGFYDEDEYEMLKSKVNKYIYPYRMEIDKIFKRMIVFKKKRYAGLNMNGEFKYKGLEVVRGDVFDLEREIQREILERFLLYGYDKSWLDAYMRDMKVRLWNGEFDNKLIYIKGVKESWDEYKSNTPQLRAWKKLGNRDVLFVEYYWAKGGDVEPVIDGKMLKPIDYKYYWNMIISMVDRLKEPFVEQKTLFSFGGE